MTAGTDPAGNARITRPAADDQFHLAGEEHVKGLPGRPPFIDEFSRAVIFLPAGLGDGQQVGLGQVPE